MSEDYNSELKSGVQLCPKAYIEFALDAQSLGESQYHLFEPFFLEQPTFSNLKLFRRISIKNCIVDFLVNS